MTLDPGWKKFVSGSATLLHLQDIRPPSLLSYVGPDVENNFSHTRTRHRHPSPYPIKGQICTWYQNHGYLDSIKAPIWLSHVKKCDLCPPEAGGGGGGRKYSRGTLIIKCRMRSFSILLSSCSPPLYRSLNVIIMRGATPSTQNLKGQHANFSQIPTRNILP